MVHLTMLTYGVNQEFRFFEGIWLHRKIRQFQLFFSEKIFLHHMRATCSELPSYISTMRTV
mgnify:CR=1 FL=1